MNIILDKDEIYQHLKNIIGAKRYINDHIPGVPHMIIFGSCLFELILTLILKLYKDEEIFDFFILVDLTNYD